MAETVIAARPLLRTRFPILVPVILVVYLAGRIIEVLPFTEPSTPIVAVEIFSALAFALVDGARQLGVRSILMFAAICLGVGGAMETIGVRTGRPYGHYEFLPLMGPQVLHVPVLLGLAYIGMAYASWSVAVLIAGASGPELSARQAIGVPLLASIVMTSWDFAQDPVWSTLLHAWRWRDGGAWFGVPLSNYAGWQLTTFLIYLAFAAYLRKQPSTGSIEAKTRSGAPVTLYGLCAVGNILQLLKPQSLAFVADSSGTYWKTNSILRESALVSFSVMGAFVLLAWSRWHKNYSGERAIKG
jgi:putative membrane protein